MKIEQELVAKLKEKYNVTDMQIAIWMEQVHREKTEEDIVRLLKALGGEARGRKCEPPSALCTG